jgi:RNA polymerase sigma-32 factor
MARRAMSAELLDARTERELARRWREEGDHHALHRLVRAYMRLAISMAAKYRRYGAAMNDLVQEAHIGLLKAASRFDPDRGVRFSTYAVWWIRASVQDFVMRNWSMVRTGSTSSQKSLFFNMRRLRARIERETLAEGPGPAAIRLEIAEELGVPLRDVEMMEGRLAGSDFSLNAQQVAEEGREWIEILEDDGPRPDDAVAHRSDTATLREWLTDAFDALTERERIILAARRLQDDPETLESLGRRFNVSKERIRQLEVQALRKMRDRLQDRHGPAVSEFVTTS